MTGLEKMCLYLAYANHEDKRILIQKLEESEEAISMGDEMLNSISKDRDAYIEYYHRMKYEADEQSMIIHARSEGIELGKEEKARDMVEMCLRRGLDVDLIKELTGLTEEQILEIKSSIHDQ